MTIIVRRTEISLSGNRSSMHKTGLGWVATNKIKPRLYEAAVTAAFQNLANPACMKSYFWACWLGFLGPSPQLSKTCARAPFKAASRCALERWCHGRCLANYRVLYALFRIRFQRHIVRLPHAKDFLRGEAYQRPVPLH
jgi:hypothetical protein